MQREADQGEVRARKGWRFGLQGPTQRSVGLALGECRVVVLWL